MKPHRHLIIRADIAKVPQAYHCARIEAWMSEVIEAIKMKELAPPKAVYCDDPENRGMTAVALLTTSHFVLHTWDNIDKPYIQLDLYSCSDFSPHQIIDLVGDKFEATSITYKFLDRDTGIHEAG